MCIRDRNKALQRIMRDCNSEVLEKKGVDSDPVLLPKFSCHVLRHTSVSYTHLNSGDDRPKFKVSDKPLDGYRHFGRLVASMKNYEV